MSGIVLQHAWGDHAEILIQTNERHNKWAEKHNLGYHQHLGKVFDDPNYPGAWAKVPYITYWLNTPVDYLIWMDADTCVRDLNFNPLLAFDEDTDIAMIHSPHKEFGFNAGVMYIRNSANVRKFYRQVWERGPVKGHKLEYLADETRINVDLPASGLKVKKLDHRWNYFYTEQARADGVDPRFAEEECHVRAWHGTPAETVRRRVKEYIAKWPH